MSSQLNFKGQPALYHSKQTVVAQSYWLLAFYCASLTAQARHSLLPALIFRLVFNPSLWWPLGNRMVEPQHLQGNVR